MVHPVKYRAELRLPAQGATETEAILAQWSVAPGDFFASGDVLAQAESDKSVFDFEAPCSGKVIALNFEVGDSVPLESTVIVIETDDPTVLQWAVSVVPLECSPSTEATPAASETSETMANPGYVEKTETTTNASASVSSDTSSSTNESLTTPNVITSQPLMLRSAEPYFLGFGSFVPSRVVENEELLEYFPEVTADYMYRVTGVHRRHWATAEEHPSDLAAAAATAAIADASIERSQIDALLVATTTPDVTMPSTACILASKLGLDGIPAFDLNAACSGWLYAVGVARGLIATGVAKTVLIVSVDLQSRLLDRHDRSTLFLFGDGAGASILSGVEPPTNAATEAVPGNESAVKTALGNGKARLCWLQMTSDIRGLTWARRMMPGDCVPGSEQGTQGVDPYVRMDGPGIFRAASEAMTRSIRLALESTGWSPADVTKVIPHQANSRILRVIEKHTDFAPGTFHVHLEEYGNTASASIPISLCSLRSQLRPGDKLILCAAGAGITVAAAAIEWLA